MINMKRLQDLTLINEEERLKQIEFFNTLDNNNSLGLHLKNEDIEILVDCLNVFQRTGINHFNRYISFMQSVHQSPLEKGIVNFLEEREQFGFPSIGLDSFRTEVEQRVSDMRFFGFSQVNGLSIEDYQMLLNHSEQEYNKFIQEKHREGITKEENEIKNLIENYFNFNDFNIDYFEQQFKRCLKEITNNKYTEKDLLTERIPYNPNSTYLVLFFSNNTPIRIGKTNNLLQWLSTNLKKHQDITFGLCLVEEKYATELLTRFCIHFDTIQRSGNTVLLSNKMYSNLNHSKKVYNHLYGLTLRQLKKIISSNGITQREFGSTIVIKKKDLDTCIKRTLKLETKKNL